MYTTQSNNPIHSFVGNPSTDVASYKISLLESDLFCVKWSPPIDGFQQFIKHYRTIINCPLGGSKSTRYSYTDPTIAKVLSVGPLDDRSALPQRVSLSNFKIGSPITSYGVILRSWYDNEPYYLIVKRNDSVSYIDIIRGNYRESQLFLMIQDLPQHERERLLKYDFDTLWYDLHQKPPEGDAYEFGKEAYQKISPHLSQLFNKIPSIDPDGKFLWLFPKGRPDWLVRTNSPDLREPLPLTPESGYECALREFNEETNGLNITEIGARLLFADPLIERHLGSNSKQYQTNYFVFHSDKLEPIVQFPTKSTNIRDISIGEVSEIRWVKQSELNNFLRPARIEFVNYIETHLPTHLPTDVNPIWKSPAEMSDYNLDES